MERVELCDEKQRISVLHARSSVAGKCWRHRCEPRHEYDENHSHFHRRWRDSSDETEGTSVGNDQRNHGHERSFDMASVDHEIRSQHSAASKGPHKRNHQFEDLYLRAHCLRDCTGRMARDSSQVGIDRSLETASTCQ